MCLQFVDSMKASSIFFFFLAMWCRHTGWDLSSSTRDQTCDPCSESADSLTTGLPGKSHFFISKIKSYFLLGEITERFCCMRVQTCVKRSIWKVSRQRGGLCQLSICCFSNLKFIFHDLTCRNGADYFLSSAGTMLNSGGLQRDTAARRGRPGLVCSFWQAPAMWAAFPSTQLLRHRWLFQLPTV